MPTPTEDLDRLLKDYDTSSQNNWTPQTREPGCSRKALRRSFVVTFVCLVAVSIGWFLHVTVFMDKEVSQAPTIQNSFISALNGGDAETKPNGILELLEKSGILEHINMTSLVEYALKHVPAEVASRLLSHLDDIKSGDFMKLVEDAQLMDGILDFLEFPDTLAPGLKTSKKVDDYDYEEVPLPTATNKDQPQSQNRETNPDQIQTTGTQEMVTSQNDNQQQQNVSPLASVPVQETVTTSAQSTGLQDISNFIQKGISAALNGPQHWEPPPTATAGQEVRSNDIFRGRRRIVRRN